MDILTDKLGHHVICQNCNSSQPVGEITVEVDKWGLITIEDREYTINAFVNGSEGGINIFSKDGEELVLEADFFFKEGDK